MLMRRHAIGAFVDLVAGDDVSHVGEVQRRDRPAEWAAIGRVSTATWSPPSSTSVVRGRRLTSWPSLRTDIRNAGGKWVDETVVIDTEGPNTLVTTREPDDLPDFCAEAVAAFPA
jgi:putative intracellular protease/amidase